MSECRHPILVHNEPTRCEDHRSSCDNYLVDAKFDLVMKVVASRAIREAFRLSKGPTERSSVPSLAKIESKLVHRLAGCLDLLEREAVSHRTTVALHAKDFFRLWPGCWPGPSSSCRSVLHLHGQLRGTALGLEHFLIFVATGLTF